MICNNSIISDSNNQAFSLSIQDKIYILGGAPSATYVAPDGLNVLSKSAISLLKELYRKSILHPKIFVRHSVLAKYAHCSRRAIQYAQKELLRLGFIYVKSGKRAHERNEYALSDLMLDKQLIFGLRNIFPLMRFVINKLKGLSIVKICNKVRGYIGLNTVNNQNCARINNVLKDSNTNTSLYIDNSNKVEVVPEKIKRKIQGEWLPSKIFQNVISLLRMDPFMSEKEARYISKYGEMSRIARERLQEYQRPIKTRAEIQAEEELKRVDHEKAKIEMENESRKEFSDDPREAFRRDIVNGLNSSPLFNS